jgi:hypothetical protein
MAFINLKSFKQDQDITKRWFSMNNLTSIERIMWRVLFWSGIISVMLGTGIASWYTNSFYHNQFYLIGGLAVIVLGITLMATGYSINQGKIKIHRQVS